jgi:hypothetical protein
VQKVIETGAIATGRQIGSSAGPIAVDRDALDRSLAAAFDGEPAERRVVVRQVMDLVDAERWAETHDGTPLTVDRIVAELEQAPDDDGLADRWNWWMGSLELAHGGFDRFGVCRWRSDG